MANLEIAVPPVLRAVMWMVAAVASFLLMMVSARELISGMSTFEILAFRSAIALLLLLPFVLRKGFRFVATRRPGLQVARNVFHLGGQVGWVIGITLLPMTEVTAIEFSTPLWSVLLAIIFLREPLSRHRAVAIALGFIGILIILRPGVAAINPGALVVIASALCYAVSIVMAKSLTRTESAFNIVFYMQIVQLPIALVPALFSWTTPGWGDAPWLFFMGAAALSAHYCLTRALVLVDVTVVLPMDFMRLPCMAVIAWLLYAEVVDPSVILGAATIFAGNFYSVRREAR